MLTTTKINNSRKKEKPYKIYDTQGLYLLITPRESKLWRLKYYFYGKEKLLSLGHFPEVGLSDARMKRDQARKLVKQNIDPGLKAEKSENFEPIAREWFAKFSPRLATATAQTNMGRLERDVFPFIGTRLIREIGPPELLTVLRRVESRGAIETAHRVTHLKGTVK